MLHPMDHAHIDNLKAEYERLSADGFRVLAIACKEIDPRGVAIPFTPIGMYLGFTQLPPLYWPLLAVSLACYVVLTQMVKMWLLRMKWVS